MGCGVHVASDSVIIYGLAQSHTAADASNSTTPRRAMVMSSVAVTLIACGPLSDTTPKLSSVHQHNRIGTRRDRATSHTRVSNHNTTPKLRPEKKNSKEKDISTIPTQFLLPLHFHCLVNRAVHSTEQAKSSHAVPERFVQTRRSQGFLSGGQKGKFFCSCSNANKER